LLVTLAGCDPGTDPNEAAVVWSVESFGGTTGTPYADDEVVVSGVAFSDRLFAVDRLTGRVRWQTRLSLPTTGFDGHLAPDLEIHRYGDLLIVASGWLYALDRLTGALRWSYKPPGDRPGRWVVLAGDRLFAGHRLLSTLDPGTGGVLAEFDLGEYVFGPLYDSGVLYLGGRIPGAPANGLVPLGEGHAMAVDATTGDVLWRHLIPDHPPFVGGVVHRGALTPDLYVVASVNARVYALDRVTGEARWVHEGPSPYNAQVAIVGASVVVGGTSGDVEGLDVVTGAPLWVNRAVSSISRMGQTPYAALPTNGRIRAFDAAGSEIWGFGGAGWRQPTFSSTPLVSGDLLFGNSVEAGLFAVRYRPSP
jgi:outer membrane protein assembly factor BamB